MRKSAVPMLGLAAALAVCAGPADAAPPPPARLRIGTFLTAIDYAPFYVAKQNGCLAALARRHGRTINYRVFHSVPAMNEAVNSGALDLILEADTPAIAQRAAGTDIREVLPLAALSQQLLVPAGSPARRLADLRGKRIGVLLGSGYHFAVVDGLAAAGVRRDEYRLVDVAPTAGGPLLANGTIDAWAIWPPILQETAAAAPVRTIAGSVETLNVYAFAAGPFMDRNGRLIDGFAGCLRAAIRSIRRRAAPAMAITAAETGLPARTVAAAWPTMRFGFRVDPAAFRVLNAQAAFLYKEGHVRRTVRFDPSSFRDRGEGE